MGRLALLLPLKMTIFSGGRPQEAAESVIARLAESALGSASSSSSSSSSICVVVGVRPTLGWGSRAAWGGAMQGEQLMG